jgi:CheY-like chemotaxis protein
MSAGKVFVIDDEDDVLAIMQEIITRAGYEVETFSSGSAALEKMQNSAPDMVFLDVQMPNMNGFQILKAIRNKDTLSKVPVVLLSSISSVTGRDYDPEIIQSKYGVHPDAFISKSIEKDVIEQHLKTFIKDK